MVARPGFTIAKRGALSRYMCPEGGPVGEYRLRYLLMRYSLRAII